MSTQMMQYTVYLLKVVLYEAYLSKVVLYEAYLLKVVLYEAYLLKFPKTLVLFKFNIYFFLVYAIVYFIDRKVNLRLYKENLRI